MSKARLVITAVVLEGRHVHEVSAVYGVARSWIYELLVRYRAEGDAAFEPRSRRPHSQPTALPSSTVEMIIGLRHQLTGEGLDAGPHTIAWHLAEQHQVQVSVASIWRTVKRAGLVIPEPKKKPKAAYVRFEAEQPNQMWQTDFTHYRLSSRDSTPGEDVEILTFLDDHSRTALSVTCHQPVTGPAVVAAFRQTTADQGIPVSVLSDNGMVFTTRFAGGPAGRDTINGFQAELRRLGVVQKHSRAEPSHHLRQGGTVPANIEEMAPCPAGPTQHPGRAANLCDTFVAYYNTRRPHRSLGRRTPSAAYQARPKAAPQLSTEAGEPQPRIRRDVVDSHGKITLRHAGRLHHIGVGRTHARTPVLMLINGLDIRIIHAHTGQIIRELILNPAVDYQTRAVRKPRTKPS